jgi:hypothetical protein
LDSFAASTPGAAACRLVVSIPRAWIHAKWPPSKRAYSDSSITGASAPFAVGTTAVGIVRTVGLAAGDSGTTIGFCSTG